MCYYIGSMNYFNTFFLFQRSDARRAATKTTTGVNCNSLHVCKSVRFSVDVRSALNP